jgi:hypothetical protein
MSRADMCFSGAYLYTLIAKDVLSHENTGPSVTQAIWHVNNVCMQLISSVSQWRFLYMRLSDILALVLTLSAAPEHESAHDSRPFQPCSPYSPTELSLDPTSLAPSLPLDPPSLIPHSPCTHPALTPHSPRTHISLTPQSRTGLDVCCMPVLLLWLWSV